MSDSKRDGSAAASPRPRSRSWGLSLVKVVTGTLGLIAAGTLAVLMLVAPCLLASTVDLDREDAS